MVVGEHDVNHLFEVWSSPRNGSMRYGLQVSVVPTAT
jgi:hypothetical protein